jgi:microcystin-dependent protein
MADPFIGQIAIFAFGFAPRGWAMCEGQLLPISQNVALFTIIGNNYGGNGKTNFALPNLQANAAIGAGQGPGLSAYNIGATGGEAAVALQAAQMPSHAHAFVASLDPGSAASPQGHLLARATHQVALKAETKAPGPTQVAADFYSPNPGSARTALAPTAVGPAGGNHPHNNLQPYLALNFCIALQGVMPPRG